MARNKPENHTYMDCGRGIYEGEARGAFLINFTPACFEFGNRSVPFEASGASIIKLHFGHLQFLGKVSRQSL
jgi:hypothetical protein